MQQSMTGMDESRLLTEGSDKLRVAALYFLYLFAAFLSISIAGTQISYTFSLLLFLVLLGKKKIDFWGNRAITLPVLSLFVVAVLATIFSLSPADSLYNLRKFLLIPIVFLIPGLIKTKKELIVLVAVFLGTAFLMALFGTGKYLYTSWNKVIATQSTTMTWGAMSLFFVLGWASLFAVLKDFRFRIISVAALIPQIAALILSYVRGSYLGMLAGLLVIGFLKQKKLMLYLFIVIIILLMLFPGSVWQRVKSIPDLNVGSTQVRLNQWRDSIGIFKDYPVLGVGWIDLHDVHIAHAPPGADLSRQEFQIGHFHNNYIQILMIFGIPGLLIFLWLCWALLRQEWNIFRKTAKDDFLQAVSLFAFAGTVGFMINGFFDWTFGDEEVVMILWFVVGLSLAAQKISGLETTEKQK
ncbi:MAG TPA: hypothetical protein ENH29_05310 [Bacteroidetes bacterium]|nr:hypothetical protein [Bacteroidota bacterium]